MPVIFSGGVQWGNNGVTCIILITRRLGYGFNQRGEFCILGDFNFVVIKVGAWRRDNISPGEGRRGGKFQGI